jgi:hypothetical protein
MTLDQYIFLLQTHCDAVQERPGVGALYEVRRGTQRNFNQRDQDANQGLVRVRVPGFREEGVRGDTTEKEREREDAEHTSGCSASAEEKQIEKYFELVFFCAISC